MYKDPKKCDTVVGDTPEELGSGLHLSLNLIIYVLKQARYHWIPSQGSRDMENIPRQPLLVKFYSQNEGETLTNSCCRGMISISREPCDGIQWLVACVNTYIIRFKPRCKPEPNSSGVSPTTMSHFLGSLYGDRGLKGHLQA